MVISGEAIVSNTDMLKNYKSCRDKVETFSKIFIIKNNKPDTVLFSITEYERVSGLLEYAEYLEKNDIAQIIDILPNAGKERNYEMGLIRKNMDQLVAVDIIK